MTKLCAVSDLKEGKSLGFSSHRGPVFAVLFNGQIYVYKNQCPHLGVNLEFMENQFLDSEGQLIQCSMHGALFEVETGVCLTGPCQREKLTKLAFEIQNDRIVLC